MEMRKKTIFKPFPDIIKKEVSKNRVTVFYLGCFHCISTAFEVNEAC